MDDGGRETDRPRQRNRERDTERETETDTERDRDREDETRRYNMIRYGTIRLFVVLGNPFTRGLG